MFPFSFSDVTKSLSQLAQKLQTEKEEFEKEGEKYSNQKDFQVDSTGCQPLWECVPEAWQNGREHEWDSLVRSVCGLQSTFLYGPPNAELRQHELQEAVNGPTKCPQVDTTFSDIPANGMGSAQLSITGCQALSTSRFQLVPGRIAEKNFWKNLFWKLRELGKCTDASQVKHLLFIINAPPLPSDNEQLTSPAYTDKLATHYAQVTEALVDLFQKERSRHWLRERLESVEDEIRDSYKSIELLNRFNSKESTTPEKSGSDTLLASLFDSCEWHKKKVIEFIREIEDKAPLHGVDLLQKLMDANTVLGEALKSRSALQPRSPVTTHDHVGISNEPPESHETTSSESKEFDAEDYKCSALPWEEDSAVPDSNSTE